MTDRAVTIKDTTLIGSDKFFWNVLAGFYGKSLAFGNTFLGQGLG